MEDLFRFMVLRPVQEADKEAVVSVAEDTPFQRALGQISQSDTPRAAMKDIAAEYVAKGNYVRDPRGLVYHARFLEFHARLGDGSGFDLERLRVLIEKTLGKPAPVLLADPDFTKDRSRVADSIIALKMLPAEHSGPLGELAWIMRLFALVERVAAKDQGLEKEDSVVEHLARTILLPSTLFPLPAASQSGSPKKPGLGSIAAGKNKTRQQLEDRGAALEATIKELLDVDLQETAEPSERIAPLTLKPEAVSELGKEARSMLAELGVDPSTTSIPRMVRRLDSEIAALAKELCEVSVGPKAGEVFRLGSTLVHANTRPTSIQGERGQPAPMPAASAMKSASRAIQPVGRADLRVVRQQVVAYEGGEIAHIENVLKGESKEREHRRKVYSETFLSSETETIGEEERELETAERFEMERESKSVIESDSEFKVGATLSASYGPFVDFTASTEYASSTSREDSTRCATTYAKDVTNRAASRVSERVREQRMRRTFEEVEEINRHSLTARDDHVIGVYQWVDKVYEAQVFEYGERTMFDVIVPEPAAFLIHALAENPPDGKGLAEPLPFTLAANEISRTNYLSLAKQYGATDIQPPPEILVTVAKAYEGTSQAIGGGDSISVKADENIGIPAEYQAKWGCAVALYQERSSSAVGGMLSIGQKWQAYSGPMVLHTFELNQETGTNTPIPVALSARNMNYAIGIEILCQLTSRGFLKWQIDTHAALTQAYLQRRDEFEERLAAQEIERGVEISGRNPAQNRILEKAELKKACIAMLAGQHYSFDAVEMVDPETGAPEVNGYPQANIAAGLNQDRIIRFLEHAFEWEQMMYVLYPYFWGRKPRWISLMHIEDTDPLHGEFLRAGAARVVFPVRPGFENAVQHFLDTHDPWEGRDLPSIGSPMYLGIIEEIKERQNETSEEPAPVGTPWRYRLPTTLVMLRQSSSLPKWKKNSDGNWVPDEGDG